jgi:transketolase
VVRTLPGKGVPALEGVLAHNLKLPPDIAAMARASLADAETKP